MAWGKKDDELPEALRGKTPEQVATELAEAAALKAKLVDLETKQTEQNAKFETFSTTMTQMNENLTAIAGRLPQPKVEKTEENEMADFITNPDLAFAQRASGLYGLQMQTAAVIGRNSAVERAKRRQQNGKGNIDGTLFEKFGEEIDNLAKSVPAAQLANPDTWDHLFYNVKGRHSDEIASHNREHKGDFFVEPTTTSTPSGDVSGDKLTPAEEKIAAKMGVAPEKYLEQKKKMVTGIPEEILR